jgi:hypothetical protein
MTADDAAHIRWFNTRRLPVDDAYTAWFNAHSCCTQALRAWNAAAPRARAAAYRAYTEALAIEETAAGELHRLHLELAV